MANFLMDLLIRIVISFVFFGFNVIILKKIVKIFRVKDKSTKSVMIVSSGITLALLVTSYISAGPFLAFLIFLFYNAVFLLLVKGYYITIWKEAILIWVIWFVFWILLAAIFAMLFITFRYYV